MTGGGETPSPPGKGLGEEAPLKAPTPAHASQRPAAHAQPVTAPSSQPSSPDVPLEAGATLLHLLTWLSPAFPTGGFAYSHGLEWAVEAGDIRTESDLSAWLDDVLRHGAGRTDAILLRHAHRAPGIQALQDLAELATAAQPARERQAETLGQGGAFALAAQVWGAPLLDALVQAGHPIPYPVAVGALAAAHAVPEDATASAALHAFTANAVSAAVRLVPLGQTAGLRVLARLQPAISAVANETRTATLDDLGGACFRSDIAAMRHETQYTRLFRS